MSQNTQVSLRKLRRLRPEEVIKKYAAYTQKIFSQCKKAVPVIIPARNEEYDLPACLLSLAQLELPVRPVVVVNCSDDKTYERAERMGATTIEINGVKKIGATQEGIRKVLAENSWPDPTQKMILFTDADTLAPRRWSHHLVRHLKKALDQAPSRGAAVFGSALYMHGPSKLADIGQCLHGFYRDALQAIQQTVPLPRGANYGVALDTDSRVLDTLLGLNSLVAYRDDATTLDKLQQANVQIVRCLHPGAMVVTRGDRAHSFMELLKNLYQTGYEQSTYDKQYDISNCPRDKRKIVN